MTAVTLGSGSAFGSDICGTVSNPAGGLPGEQIASPCDGDSNLDPSTTLDPDKLPYTGSTFWLSSFERSPSPIPPNFGGIAERLVVKAYPYPDQATCEALPGGSPNACSVRENLPAVTETFDATTLASIGYETSWKTKKSNKGGPGAGDFVPNDSYWQVVVFLDFDGNGVQDTEDIASRIIKWTDTPSSDQPLDGWSLDIQWGSNQPIPFVLDPGQEGCFGQARDLADGSADGEVSCLVNGDDGATLIVDFGNGEGQGIEIGAGNGFGLAVVTGEVCTDASGNPQDLDVDTRTLGTCVEWTFDPPLSQNPGDELIDSFIYACEDLGSVGGATFFMQDALGTQALPPISIADANAFCNNNTLFGSNTLALQDPGTGLQFVLNKIKQVFAPKTAIATDGSSGSRLLTSRSDFQVVETAQMQALGATALTVPENSANNLLQGQVYDHAIGDGESPVQGAQIYVYSDATVSCVAGTTCSPLGPPAAGDIWSTGIVVTTGSDGIWSAEVAVGTTTATAWALGCGIAVPGSDTPADGGYPGDGVGEGCDRDPSDVNDPASGNPDGFANGIAPGVVDPFMQDGVAVMEWINDLPITYTLQVCSAPTVNGVKDATDPWSQGTPSSCIPNGSSGSFEVNVGGNLGGNQGPVIADLEWFVGGGSIYFGLEIPLASDPTSKKVNVAIEFDAGDGSSPGADEFDDQIEINLDKFAASPTGDVLDRYLTASCANNNSLSVCNALDTDVGGTNSAVGAMAWNPNNNTLFVELGQSLSGDDPVDLHDLVSGETIGFILQLGVGNVQQGGTVFPEQVGGKTYQPVDIP